MESRTLNGLAAAILAVSVAGVLGAWWWAGQQVTPPPPPVETGPRWASLSPPITETVFALGAGDALVARSDWCDHPEAALPLPAVGSGMGPDVEALALLRTTHVLVEDSPATSLDLLEPLAEVEPLPWLTLEEATGSIRRLGALFDREAAADDLAGRFEDALGATAPPDAPRAMVVFATDDLGQGPLWILRANSLHGRAIEAAGLRNAVPEPLEGAPSVPLERLLREDPDLILVMSADPDLAPAERERLLHAFDHLEPLTAPREGRVGVLSGPDVLSTGPRLLGLPAALRAEVARLGRP